jgi:hypothetical protein
VSVKESLRKLFTDHAVYTEFVIRTFLSGGAKGDVDALSGRLLENQTEIGNFLIPLIGMDAGHLVTKLLKEHILQAVAVLKALKGGNKKRLDAEIEKLFQNSAEVSKALSSLSSRLPYDIVKREFDHHNQMVIELAVLHHEGKYADEVKKFDAYYNHMLSFSDLLFYGLSR